MSRTAHSMKQFALEALNKLPDDCTLDEIAQRMEFLAAVKKGMDQLDGGEGIAHAEVKKQLAEWLTH